MKTNVNWIAACILLCAVSVTRASASSQQLTILLDDIWQYELTTNPIMATRLGVHDYDDQLSDISPKSLHRQNQQFRSFLDKLDNLDTTSLSQSEKISVIMQRYRLQNYVDQYNFNSHYMPLTSESGFHSSLAFLPRSSRFNSVKDYENYLSRLSKFPSYFSQQIAWMKKGIETGFVQPKSVLLGFENSVKAFVHDAPSDSLYYAPFKDLSDSPLTKEQQLSLKQQAETIISNKVFPAYQAFYDFLIQDYIPNSKQKVGANSWKDGLAYYQNRSNYYTTTSMSVEDIHQLGLEEVTRIRNEMQLVLNTLDFDGDINEFIHFLRTDPQFYAKTPEELIKEASYIAKKMDSKLPLLFNKLPRTPYGVEAVPDNIAPKYTTGRYIGPTRDNQPGFYWVNTYALDKRPLYALTALTLHEAVPGHHLQISLSRELQELPEVRRYTYISAFGEGWGLYSEFLGKEVGMYENPYHEFGRLSYEMWRACRLVVDTGMHVKGWSRQQAIDYMLENTALSEHNVRTEVDRYISWPAQALSYKIGELTIKQLRQQAKNQLGDRFDLRAFHNAVLEHGSIPLSVLKINVEKFIHQN